MHARKIDKVLAEEEDRESDQNEDRNDEIAS
jgi:hypothetical protein